MPAIIGIVVLAIIGIVAFLVLRPAESSVSEIDPGATEGSQGAEAALEAEQVAGGSSEGASESEAAFPDNPEPLGTGPRVPDVAEGHLARIALPQPAMSLVEFDTSEQYAITATAGEVTLFKLFSPSSTSKKYPDEKKKRVYSLGYAGNGFDAVDVQLELYYINAAGTGNAHWNDAAATKLAIEELLGLTDDELVAGIELRDMQPADVVDNPNPEVKWKLSEEFVLIGDDAS